ncbi:Uncharacterised protein [Mycobacteroides abscessus subsp. abscessus]|nr:Uncharacterised protein [Mycobacteroides abscessus subsp. abscessus]
MAMQPASNLSLNRPSLKLRIAPNVLKFLGRRVHRASRRRSRPSEQKWKLGELTSQSRLARLHAD